MTPQGHRAPPKINSDNYGMDLNSDDSTDDESHPRKPIPSWARGEQGPSSGSWSSLCFRALEEWLGRCGVGRLWCLHPPWEVLRKEGDPVPWAPPWSRCWTPVFSPSTFTWGWFQLGALLAGLPLLAGMRLGPK